MTVRLPPAPAVTIQRALLVLALATTCAGVGGAMMIHSAGRPRVPVAERTPVPAPGPGSSAGRVPPVPPPTISTTATTLSPITTAPARPTSTPPGTHAAPPSPRPVVYAPASIAADCSTDVSAALAAWLSSVPDGSVVSFASRGCYRTDGVITFAHHNNVTLEGNGATLRRVTPNTAAGWFPHLQLFENTNLTITGLTILGTLGHGGSGGASEEGHYGMVLAGNHHVRLDNDVMWDIEGDFMNFFPPGLHGDDPSDVSLNYDVTVTNSTFTNSGYHGITIESADGVLFSNDQFSNIGLDGIDMEYDTYGTVFGPDGTPEIAAEINITFDHTTWTNVNQEWLVSWQGSVVTKNISLTNNQLHAGFPGFWIDVGSLTPQTMYDGFTIVGNSSDRMLVGAGDNLAFNFTYVKNITVESNTVSVGNKWAGQYYGVSNVVVRNNQFPYATSAAAVDPISGYTGRPWPGAPSVDVTSCGNLFGPNDSLSDEPC